MTRSAPPPGMPPGPGWLRWCELLLPPTMPTTAPAFPPLGPPDAQVADPARAPYTDCWAVVANLAGLPAVSVPAGRGPRLAG